MRAICRKPALALACALAASSFAAGFPQPYNSEPSKLPLSTPEEALASLKLPPGFTATLFAHEPDVQNPIAMTFDPRGRMWVAENYTYADKTLRFDLALRDRVIILEDKDGDGRAESRKVFTDQVQLLTSVELGRGGVWLMCPPQLLFIPDKDGDDVPDGEPQVVLDGFTVAKANYHNFANGLRWGPDGWLYGRCGASCPGEVGVPGTPVEQRVPMRGGMWRFHPERKVFEALTHGTTNPWGHDWDEHGELFFINTVNGHLWHAFAGAHFVRPHTQDPNPHAYAAIDMHADHWHFDTGKGWTASRDGKANDFGGGHSHQGAMIPQGQAWPEAFRGRLFTLNLHGRRANMERLERSGSGYVARHEPDPFTWGDVWFRGIDIRQGPGGAAYVLDWSDTGECHDSSGVHRTSGRIYRITPGPAPIPKTVDLSKRSPAALIELLSDGDLWNARQAQRQLEIRSHGERLNEPHEAMRAVFSKEKGTALKLRALWALSATGGADAAWLRERLADSDEHIRVWAIRLLTDEWPLDTVDSTRVRADVVAPPDLLADIIRLARTDPSGLVRLTLASTLQRLPISNRADLASALVSREEDARDHNLPALVWFGLIPVAESDPAAILRVAEAARWPDTMRWITRRLALASEKSPAPFNELLALSAERPPDFQQAVLRGAGEAFNGWRKAAKPQSWDSFSAAVASTADEPTRSKLRDLSTLFGDGRALEEVKRVALDNGADLPAREAALRTLIESRPPDLRAICERLLDTRTLNITAVRGLALVDDPAVGKSLVGRYGKFSANERPAIIETLVTRPPWATALLEAIGAGTIPRADLSAFHARQIRGFNDAVLTARLTEVWGSVRESAADKRELIASTKAQLTPAVLAKADLSKGRAAFNSVCAACHKLYGEGAHLGPDLTGSGRENLDYLLENIIDPSAVVTADFRLVTLTLKDGRTLTGMITEKNERTLSLRTITETQPVERVDIANLAESSQSLMPEGLLAAFTPEQVRDLMAYLMSKQQAPLPSSN